MFRTIGQYGAGQHATHEEMKRYEYNIKCNHRDSILVNCS